MVQVEMNAKNYQELQTQLKAATKKKAYRRLKVLDLSYQGYKVAEIGRILDVSGETVRRTIHRFNRVGLAGLHPQYTGRPEVRINWTQEKWLDLLAQAPAHYEKLESGSQNWNQHLIRRFLWVYHQIHVSQSTISRTLSRVGLNYKRIRLRIHSPDPHYVVKRQRIDDLKRWARQGELNSEKRAHPRSDEPPRPGRLLFLDSTDLHWCPQVGATYSPMGHQVKVDTPGGQNPWRALFGSLVYPSGDGLYSIHGRKRSQDLRAHLLLLIELDPDVLWFVVLDNAPAHTTALIEAFAEQHANSLELVFLPTYSPHLNLIERLWRLMRLQVVRNHFFESVDSLAQAVVAWLETLPFSQFCSLLGFEDSDFPVFHNPCA